MPLPRPQPQSAAAPPFACDELWKLLTARATRELEAGNVAFARTLYDAAWTEAERVLELARRGAPDAVRVAPMLLNIACHNLAELCLRQGDDAGARHFFERAFETLVAVATEPHPLALRAGAARHLGVATAAFVRFLGERGLAPEAERLVARANATLALVLQLASPPAES